MSFLRFLVGPDRVSFSRFPIGTLTDAVLLWYDAAGGFSLKFAKGISNFRIYLSRPRYCTWLGVYYTCDDVIILVLEHNFMRASFQVPVIGFDPLLCVMMAPPLLPAASMRVLRCAWFIIFALLMIALRMKDDVALMMLTFISSSVIFVVIIVTTSIECSLFCINMPALSIWSHDYLKLGSLR